MLRTLSLSVSEMGAKILNIRKWGSPCVWDLANTVTVLVTSQTGEESLNPTTQRALGTEPAQLIQFTED